MEGYPPIQIPKSPEPQLTLFDAICPVCLVPLTYRVWFAPGVWAGLMPCSEQCQNA